MIYVCVLQARILIFKMLCYKRGISFGHANFWLGTNSIVDSVSEKRLLPFLVDQLVCQETSIIEVKK
jgi:hypothetical protein